jgi:hypothetical protein
VSDPHTTERLAHVEAIKVLKARYFRAVDTKDWAGLAELFCADATLDAGVAVRDGADQIIRTMSRALADVVSVHHGHMPEIDVIDDRTATGIWAMDDHLEWPTQSTERGAPVGFRGSGHYHDHYRRDDDGRWRFSSVVLTRLRIDPLPGGMPAR